MNILLSTAYIVAMKTSLPESVVPIVANITGRRDISVGTVEASSTFSIVRGLP